MSTLNNNFYLFSMKYLYRNDSTVEFAYNEQAYNEIRLIAK